MPRRSAGGGREQRHLEIVDISAEIFAKRGFNAVGVAEISEAVGLGRGALYHYIGSKDQLLLDIQERVLGPIGWLTDEILALERHPLVQLRLISHFLLEIMTSRLAHVWVYQHDYRSLSDESRATFIERRRRIETVVRDLITRCIDDGTFAKADPKLRTLEFFNHHNYTYQWFNPGGGWTPAQLSAAYSRTLLLGFGCTSDAIDACEARSRKDIKALAPRFAKELE